MTPFTDYQVLVLSVMGFMDVAAAFIAWFFCFCLLKYGKFRDAVVEAIQDTDTKFHWVDAKNASYLFAGFLCALFTMNIAGIVLYAKMFEPGALVVLSLFIGATFTLFGIAWKK